MLCAGVSSRRISRGAFRIPYLSAPGWECWTHPSEPTRLKTIGNDCVRRIKYTHDWSRLKTIQNHWATAPCQSFWIVSYRFFLEGQPVHARYAVYIVSPQNTLCKNVRQVHLRECSPIQGKSSEINWKYSRHLVSNT